MAHKSALGAVLAMQLPVIPSKGGQPAYYRSKHSIQVSSKLKRLQSCIGDEMRDKKYDSRADVRKAFTAASKKCKGG